MAGVIFAKLAKPKHRANTIMFSRNAVVCLRDGEHCLIFRVADMRSSQLVGERVLSLATFVFLLKCGSDSDAFMFMSSSQGPRYTRCS